MYPLKFEHIYQNKIWGARNLAKFRKDLPAGEIGESWELTCHKKAVSRIANGEFSGMGLDELIKLKSQEVLGRRISPERFPLLVKFLDAGHELSIQVHPGDSYALTWENDLGKNEAWVVLEAGENASMVLGLKDCDPGLLQDYIHKGELEQYLNRIPVKKGDVFYIESGLIHSMAGVLAAEIQQNSDVTYRVYDFQRGRELHLGKALDVIDGSLRGRRTRGLSSPRDGYIKTYYCFSHVFSLEEYRIETECSEISDIDRFYIFICTAGEGKILYEGGSEDIIMGDTMLIPAALGRYTLRGPCTLLKSYVPDIDLLEKEILGEIKCVPQTKPAVVERNTTYK